MTTSIIITKDLVQNAYEVWKTTTSKTDSIMFCNMELFKETGFFSCMNNTEMKTQMRMWRKLAKIGGLTIRFINSKSKTLDDGKTWHWLVIQPTGYTGIDPLGAMVLGEMVNGFIYCFKSKENRDKVQEYVMKGLDQKPFESDSDSE